MNKLKLFLCSFLCVVIFILFIILSGAKHSIEGGKKFILPAFKTEVVKNYKPKTGDILTMHYLTHGMIGIPVAEHWPTHTAFVWVKNKKAYILECTKFSAPALPNVLKKTKDKERGVRCVPLDEFINSVDNVLYLRKIKGHISSKKVQKIVNEWAQNIDFETRIADSMTFDLTVAIGFVPVWPKLSEWCARTAKLHEDRTGKAFCSEFVSQLFQKLDVIDKDFKLHYRISPASFLHTVGEFDKLAINNYSWEKDTMLVRQV